MDYQKTGRVISTRRQELGLTQKQLAQQLNISDRTVSRWERGVGFPDVSLLEPLADALGLSLGELIRGERLPSARQPSPEAEQEARAAAIGLGGYLRQALRRTRRLLIALSLLLACALAGLLLLWLNPIRAYSFDSQTVSAAQAAQVCPFALITRQEFELAARLLEDEEFAGLFSAPGEGNPPLHELSPDLVDADALQIRGQDVLVTSVCVHGQVIYIDYSTVSQDGGAPPPSAHRCILTICQDGTVAKTSARYEDGCAAYIVDNTDNTGFILSREHRDLLYFLHDY